MYFQRSQAHLVPPEQMQALIAEQKVLAEQVKIQPLGFEPQIIAGVDSALISPEEIFSVFVVFKYPELEVIEISHAQGPTPLPYIPGFLAFREIPTLLKAFDKLKTKPELLVVDGNGIIHKRKIGIASQLGVKLNLPSFGIAKSLLVGNFVEPGLEAGNSTPVTYKDELLGFALRTKNNVKPVFVSPGHLIDFQDSLELTKLMTGKYRLPEPTRIADKYSKLIKHGENTAGLPIFS